MRKLKLLQVLMVLIISTTVGAKENIKVYTDSSDIFLVLAQAMEDVEGGEAKRFGESFAWNAMIHSGFSIKKIEAIDMGDKVQLLLSIADGNGTPIKTGKDGDPTSLRFSFEGPKSLWKNLIQ